MSVPVADGVTVSVPLVACAPLHAPLAVHDAALVDDHVSVLLEPRIMVAGETETVTVGAAGALTVRVAEAPPLPPLPVQVKVYVAVPALEGVSVAVPLAASVPLQAPLAVHEVAFVDDQVRVALDPRVIVVGLTDKVTVGCGLLPAPPQPVMMLLSVTHPSSSHRPRGKFPGQELWFPRPANLSRVGKAAFLPVTCACISAFPPPARGLCPTVRESVRTSRTILSLYFAARFSNCGAHLAHRNRPPPHPRALTGPKLLMASQWPINNYLGGRAPTGFSVTCPKCRLFVHVDCGSEMRALAFLDPGAFMESNHLAERNLRPMSTLERVLIRCRLTTKMSQMPAPFVWTVTFSHGGHLEEFDVALIESLLANQSFEGTGIQDE